MTDRLTPCTYRGSFMTTGVYRDAYGDRATPVYRCAVHDLCTHDYRVSGDVPCCADCLDYNPRRDVDAEETKAKTDGA